VKGALIAGGVLVVGLIAWVIFRRKPTVGQTFYAPVGAPPAVPPPIDPPSQGQSTLLTLASAPKAAVCAVAAKYYTAGLATPVCGPVIKVTNALDKSTLQGAKNIASNIRSGNVTGTAKAIVTAPLNQAHAVISTIGNWL
jgi:hypothetical protein